MNNRKEYDIVKNALEILRAPVFDNKLNFLEDIESRLMIAKLKPLLEKFEKSTKEATQESLDILKEFLRMRAKRIIGTPRTSGTSVLYCYQPNSLVNKVCISLAKDLATVYNYRVEKLLLPMVDFQDFRTHHFNDFIITKDGFFMPLLASFEKVRADKDHCYYHPAMRVINENNGQVEHEKIDAELLRGHSLAAERYADEINKRLLILPSTEDNQICDKAKILLEKELANENYHRRWPAYGEEGQKRLLQSFTKGMHSITDLAEFMSSYVDKEDWEEFLTRLDCLELHRIVLAKKFTSEIDVNKSDAVRIDELIKGTLSLPVSELAMRAQCYILAFTLQLSRKSRKEAYTGYLPSITGYVPSFFGISWQQKSKEQSVEYLDLCKAFLLNEDQMADINNYLVDHAAKKGLPPLTGGVTLDLVNKIILAGQQCTAKPINLGLMGYPQ